MPRTTAAHVKQFNAEVEGFSKNLFSTQLVAFHKKITLEVFRRIVLKTPVDTGRARGNWLIGIGSVPQGVLDRLASGDGSGVVFEELAKLASLQPFSIVWITNNLDYIEFLEQGSSRQAPNGMVALSLAEVGEILT